MSPVDVDVIGRRFARLATDAVMRQPRLWRLFRAPLRRQFDLLASSWETRIGPAHLDALREALEQVPPPGRALDLGTGIGTAAVAVARRFPEAEVIGVDLSQAMVDVATAKLPDDLDGRVSYIVADASALPLPDASCQLVTLSNMIPFFAELDRVLAQDGSVLVSFSGGPATPIWVPPDVLRRELGRRGFTHFADFASGAATCFAARRGEIDYGPDH